MWSMDQDQKREKLNPKYFGSGIHIHNSIKFYGRKNFIRETLEEFEFVTGIDAGIKETYWVKKLDASNPLVGYNIANEGSACSGGWKHSDDTRAKISLKVREAHKNDPTIGERISKAVKEYGKVKN